MSDVKVVPVEPTDEMVRVSLAVDLPATYRTYLRHPSNGLKAAADTERAIERERKRWSAMLSAAPVLSLEGGGLRGSFSPEGAKIPSGDVAPTGEIAAIVSANVSVENGTLVVNSGEVERQVRDLFADDGINWKAEWEAVCSRNIQLAEAARPFAAIADEFGACGDGQPIGVKAASGKSDLNVGHLRRLNAALIHQAATPDGSQWRPIDTLPHPKDAGLFYAAIQTCGINSPVKWEVHLIALDDETHDVHINYDQGWRIENYEFWQPGPTFPVAPDASQPLPAAPEGV